MTDHQHHHDVHDHEEVEKMILTLEDDSEMTCSIVAEFQVEGKDYIALLPDGEERVLLYAYKETHEGPELFIIEEDDEFDVVSQAYQALIEELEEMEE